MSGIASTSIEARRVTLVAAALAVALAVPSPASAQFDGGRLGAEAALTTGTVAGSDFDNVGLGVGGELGLRYAVTPRFSVGLAGQASWHAAGGLDGPFRLLGAVVEPRYRTRRLGADLRPFVGARLGLARWDVGESGEGVAADVGAVGYQAGAVAGVGYPISDRTRLEVAAVGSFLSFGDAEVDATVDDRDREPFVRQGSETAGSSVGLRASLRFRLP